MSDEMSTGDIRTRAELARWKDEDVDGAIELLKNRILWRGEAWVRALQALIEWSLAATEPEPKWRVRFAGYLAEQESRVGPAVVSRVEEMLERVAEAGMGALHHAGPTEGGVYLAWLERDLSIHITVRETGWDWFFRDRGTDTFDGEDLTGVEISDRLRSRIAELLAAGPAREARR